MTGTQYGDPTAVVGQRIIQYIIDALIVGVPGAVVYIVLLFVLGDQVDTIGGGTTYSLTGGTFILIWFLSVAITVALWLYNWVYLQGKTGQSIGMKALGLTVVLEDGSSPPGAGKAFIRNLLLIVDVGICFLIGLITMIVSTGHKRVGDMAANTYVVKKDDVGRPPLGGAAAPPVGGEAYPPQQQYPPQQPPPQQYPPQQPPPQQPPPQQPPPQAPPPPPQQQPPPQAPQPPGTQQPPQ